MIVHILTHVTESLKSKLDRITGTISVMDFDAGFAALGQLNRIKKELDDTMKQRDLAERDIRKKFHKDLQTYLNGSMPVSSL